VVRRSVLSRNLVNEKALAHCGAVAPKGEGGSNWENDVTKTVQGLNDLREEELKIETY